MKDGLIVGESSDDFLWNFILSCFVDKVAHRLVRIELVGTTETCQVLADFWFCQEVTLFRGLNSARYTKIVAACTTGYDA